MKLLLSDEEIRGLCMRACDGFDMDDIRKGAQAQLNHIFNLDIKTTVELIDKLRKRLDNLLEREMAK